MRLRHLIFTLCLAVAITSQASEPKPNVVIIYADDLGYGDVSCYGAKTIQTPGIDRLARSGLVLTHAHSAAATCTPSRYSLLTGEYAWRKKDTAILPGDASLIIPLRRRSLPAMLKAAGYATGAVGKWHLGLGVPGVPPDWNKRISPGPAEIGFDYSYIVPATLDRVPCVFVENQSVVGLDPRDPIVVNYAKNVGDWPTGREHPELLRVPLSEGHDGTIINGISRIGYMTGGATALWNDETVADVLTSKAMDFIAQHRDRPFFLYFATTDIHVPRAPHPRFAGRSGMASRGDVILQLDESVRKIMAELDRLHLTRNTLVIFTSDNGPVVDDGYADGAYEHLGSHTPAGPYRGGKYSAFEGGTRVPFIVSWPDVVRPATSDALVGQTDLYASLADLVGSTLQPDEAPDSNNVLPALLGRSGTGAPQVIEQAAALAITRGKWKYIEPHRGPRYNPKVRIELGNDPQPQLYDLEVDRGEKNNVAGSHPEVVRELADLLSRLREQGGSRAK